MPIDRQTFQFREKISGQVTGNLVGTDGVTPLPGSTLSGLFLTLYVIKQNGTDEILNGRNHQNVLQTNNVTIDEVGHIVWEVQPADTTIVETFLLYERHIGLLEWEWPTNHQGRKEFILNVENLRRVN